MPGEAWRMPSPYLFTRSTSSSNSSARKAMVKRYPEPHDHGGVYNPMYGGEDAR